MEKRTRTLTLLSQELLRSLEPGFCLIPKSLAPSLLPLPLPSFQDSQLWCINYPKAPVCLQEELQETLAVPWVQKLNGVQSGSSKLTLPFQAEAPLLPGLLSLGPGERESP